jgi:microcystin-dependent protein
MFDKDTLKTIGLIVIALFIYKQFFSHSEKGIKEKFQTTTTIPTGVIVAWNGSVTSIPAGWALCNGQTVTSSAGTPLITPDLRGRFILGVNSTQYTDTNGQVITSRTVGTTGGKEQHILTLSEMPSHRHSFGRDWWGVGPDREGVDLGNVNDQGSSGPDESGKTTYTGGQGGTSWTPGTTAPHENMPPFYVLAYIIKL